MILIQEPSEVLKYIGIALAVSEVLNACLAVFRAYVITADAFCPVGGVQNKGIAKIRICLDIGDLVKDHLIARRSWQTAHVHVRGAVLHVAEKWVWSKRSKGAFADPLRTVNHAFQRFLHFSAGNLH